MDAAARRLTSLADKREMQLPQVVTFTIVAVQGYFSIFNTKIEANLKYFLDKKM